MNAMTDEEVAEFERQRDWAAGLKINEEARGFYDDTLGTGSGAMNLSN